MAVSLKVFRKSRDYFLISRMRVRKLDPELLGDGGYTCVGVVNDDCPDVNPTGTYSENRFSVEKFVDVDDANFLSGCVVSIIRFIGYYDAKIRCFLHDLLGKLLVRRHIQRRPLLFV